MVSENTAQGTLARKGILTRDQLARELHMTQETVVEWERRGMPSIKEGRAVFYCIDDVIRWMKRKKKQRKAA